MLQTDDADMHGVSVNSGNADETHTLAQPKPKQEHLQTITESPVRAIIVVDTQRNQRILGSVKSNLIVK